jgi:membrane fusion protein (multidrug efflux system)
MPAAGTIDPRAAISAPAPAAKTPRVTFVLPGLVLAAAAAYGAAYAASYGKETTDDAQVEGHVANVTVRVAGQVKRVLVEDNQLVQAGEVLVELDDRDYVARLSGARADLAAARASLVASETQLAVTVRTNDANLRQANGGMVQARAAYGTSRAAIAQAKADLAIAESRRDLARLDFTRSETLLRQGGVAQQELDTKKSLLEQAEATVEQAQARLQSAQEGHVNSSGNLTTAHGRLVAALGGPEQLEAARAQVGVAQARVEQAQAALDQAELNASFTQIRAATGGVVSRRTVEVGQMLSPDKPLMAIVPLDDVWVVANFKEDQVAAVAPGQAATVKVDAFGSRVFPAHVASLSAATGSRFALLPPDNASGNFTKVVQRVPVLVRLDAPASVPLRPGMSATVTALTPRR